MTVYPVDHDILGHGTCNVCSCEIEYTVATGFNINPEPCTMAGCAGTILKW